MRIDDCPLKTLWFAMMLSSVLTAWQFFDHAVLAAHTGEPMKPFWKLKTL